MIEKKPGMKASIRKSIQEKREEIDLANIKLVQSGYLGTDQSMPLVIQPAMDGVNPVSWAASNKAYIHGELARHGALLLRNFRVDTPAKFETFARALSKSGELFDEYGDLPRDDPGAQGF